MGHFGGLISIAYVVKRLNPLINGLYLGLKTTEFLGEFKFSTLRRRPRENSGYFLMMKPNERTSANQCPRS